MGTMYTGTLTTFVVSATTYTMSGTSTQKAMNYVSVQDAPQVRIITLPTGDKYNIDASTGANIIKGAVYQDVFHTTAGNTAYSTNGAALGKSGTLTMSTVAGASKTCTAVMTSIEPKTPMVGSDPARLIVRYGFECMTDWS